MGKLFDAEGNEVEALTPEEVAAKEKEIREEEQATAKTATEEAEKKAREDLEAAQNANKGNESQEELQKSLDETKAELARMEGKDYDWSKLREQGKEKDTAINELKGTIHDLTTKLGTVQQDTTVGAIISKLAGTDEELAKKITLNFNRLGGAAGKTPEQIEKDIRDSYLMTTNTAAPSTLPGSGSSGAGGEGGTGDGGGSGGPKAGPPLSEDLKTLAGHFGMTAEDLEKHDHPTGQFRPGPTPSS